MSNIFDNSWEPKVSLSVTCRTILVFMCNHKSDCLSCCHISHISNAYVDPWDMSMLISYCL